MSFSQFKNISTSESFMHKIDGRIKTVVFMVSIIISAVLSSWYLVIPLWIGGIYLFSKTKIKWNKLIRRLCLPFGLSWLVFISVIFTNGNHIIWSFHFGIFHLNLYYEGLKLGILIQLRIITAITFGSLLAFTTPMVEILETLRLLKVPNTIIDIADMMYRYVFIIEEIGHNMRIAQVSRMGDNVSIVQKIKDNGKVAGYVIIKSMDKSVNIYNAMLSRGYNENTRSLGFFNKDIPTEDWIFGGIITSLLLVLVCISIIQWLF